MKAKTYILAMLSAFPQTQDVDALMLAFEIGCSDMSPEYVCKVAQDYIRGNVDRDNHRFAPTVPEFVNQCKERIWVDTINSREPAKVLEFPKGKWRQLYDAGKIPQADAAAREQASKMIGDENAG